VTAQASELLYQQACDAGDAASCNVFALMLETGSDVPQDLPRAASLYERACGLGAFAGCANLGLMHESGTGVARNIDRARMLHAVACRGGEPIGCERLDALADVTASGAPDGDVRRGRVRHVSTGAPLGETLITVGDGEASALSDPQGFFLIVGLPPGEYPLRAERVGYESSEGRIQVPFEGDLLILMTPGEFEDPGAPGRIEGRVVGDQGDELRNVEVSVVGQPDARALTNGQGRFAIQGIQPGTLEVRFALLGHAQRSATLVVQPGLITEVNAALSTEVIEMAPIEVTVRSSYLERNGFYGRRRMGFGRFFDIRDIEEISPMMLSDVLRRVPGVRIGPGGRRGMDTVAQSRRSIPWGLDPNPGTIFQPVPNAPQDLGQRGYTPDSGCTLSVYVDGVPSFDSDLDWIPPSWLQAVEVYTSALSTPNLFWAGSPTCGAVVVWTRR
jgi:hypothetical protein